MAKSDLKENFQPAEPVSYRYYNEVAKRLKDLTHILREVKGYKSSGTLFLVVVNGEVQLLEGQNCTTT